MTAPNIVSPTTITLKNVASTVPAGMAGGMFGVWLYRSLISALMH